MRIYICEFYGILSSTVIYNSLLSSPAASQGIGR